MLDIWITIIIENSFYQTGVGTKAFQGIARPSVPLHRQYYFIDTLNT